ncbi:MAG: DUF4388 domain-containing protein [Planctomycetota bacterium]
MPPSHEIHPLFALVRELEALAQHVRAFEAQWAGRMDPIAGEILTRLASAQRALAHVRGALAGVECAEGEGGDHLQGSSRAVPIQDLLCFLATTKKSGVLRVEAEKERFLLQLEQGAVVYASGNAAPHGAGLSELLAAQGVRSAELPGSIPEKAPAGAWQDPNLLGTSWIARDVLERAIQGQTRLAFFRLCAASRTRFRFYEGVEIQNVVPVRQKTVELLLAYSAQLDETAARPRPILAAPEATRPTRTDGAR